MLRITAVVILAITASACATIGGQPGGLNVHDNSALIKDERIPRMG